MVILKTPCLLLIGSRELTKKTLKLILKNLISSIIYTNEKDSIPALMEYYNPSIIILDYNNKGPINSINSLLTIIYIIRIFDKSACIIILGTYFEKQEIFNSILENNITFIEKPYITNNLISLIKEKINLNLKNGT